MRESSKSYKIFSKRVAGGEIAAENVRPNGLLRASRKADAEYVRRREALRKQTPAYESMRKEGVRSHVKQGGTAGIRIYPVPAIVGAGFLFAGKRRKSYPHGGIYKKEGVLSMRQNLYIYRRWRKSA